MTAGTEQIAITVNGRATRSAARRLDALLGEIGLASDGRGIAIAVNGAVVPRIAWDRTPLAPGDAIEIVGAVQGG